MSLLVRINTILFLTFAKRALVQRNNSFHFFIGDLWIVIHPSPLHLICEQLFQHVSINNYCRSGTGLVFRRGEHEAGGAAGGRRTFRVQAETGLLLRDGEFKNCNLLIVHILGTFEHDFYLLTLPNLAGYGIPSIFKFSLILIRQRQTDCHHHLNCLP